MIEILIKYIQDKGFEVNVLPGMLSVSKSFENYTCGYTWFISKHNLTPEFEECLYYDANRLMDKIDKAIAERAIIA